MNWSRLFLRLLLGKRLPITSGSLTVAGPSAPVHIHRDRWGVPHIEAHNEVDAAFGVGFCHGQDRTFQLEIILRVGRGLLAELVGPDALPIDRLSRRIGFYHAAKLRWPLLDDRLRASIQAYSTGVRAGGALGLQRRPHEFALLRRWPAPWGPADCLAMVGLISFTLPSNWDVELARLHVLVKDGPEALAALDPAYPTWLPLIASPDKPAGPALDRLAEDLAALRQLTGLGGGSNNWALAPGRTATGRPILANDPHLRASLPPHWYLVHVMTPDWSAAGATFMGGPMILSGHNGKAAWGVTAGLVDNTDLFIEEVHADGARVRQGDGWAHCEVREEVIPVRRAAAVTERVLVTPRGPIVSPALDTPGLAVSMKATWLQARPSSGLMRLQWLGSFDELDHGLGPWTATTQSVAYADDTGTIGWKIVGQAPRRRKGHGTLPLPGWDEAAGWQDELVPPRHMPHAVNPAEGFVATANNKPVAEDTGPYLGTDWIDGYRAASIRRRLAARTDWDVAATLALQTDRQALAWDDLREAVLAAPADNPDTARALEMLRGWDGRVEATSPAAAVYELFVAEMAGRVVRAKAPHSAPYALGGRLNPLIDFNLFAYRRTGHLARLLREQPAGWFERSWPAEIADALAAAVHLLRRRKGEDVQAWAWGRARPLVLPHPMGHKRSLAKVFNLGPVPFGGDADTINQGSMLLSSPLGPVDNIASVRVVIDVGAWGNSRFSLPGGQSGNPFSVHYADLFPLWLRGEGIPIAWTAEEVRAATRQTLVLTPSGVTGSGPSEMDSAANANEVRQKK